MLTLSQEIATAGARCRQIPRQHRSMYPPWCAAVGKTMRRGKAYDVPEVVLYTCPYCIPYEHDGDWLCACDRKTDHTAADVYRCASRRGHDWRTEPDDAAGSAYARFAGHRARATTGVSRPLHTEHPRARRRPAGGPGRAGAMERHA